MYMDMDINGHAHVQHTRYTPLLWRSCPCSKEQFPHPLGECWAETPPPLKMEGGGGGGEEEAEKGGKERGGKKEETNDRHRKEEAGIERKH